MTNPAAMDPIRILNDQLSREAEERFVYVVSDFPTGAESAEPVE